jgi:hypothetical protein
MSTELEKIKYHVRMLAEALDYEEFPIPHLAIELDWSEAQLNKAHDIFEKYDRLLEEKKNPTWRELENDLKTEFDIGYQAVKSIVNAFHANGQWGNVCYWFAKAQEPTCPIELKHIVERRV